MQEDFKPRKNPIGKEYGKLLVISFSHRKGRLYYYNCKCDCGKEVVKNTTYLFGTINPHKSCGCWHKRIILDMFTTHNDSKSKTYKTWCGMKYRCYVPTSSGYKWYGARGIKVCDRWLNSYENFLADMGECPDGMTIDRIDVNGDYCPENCRWANIDTQSNNRTDTILIKYNGDTKSLKQWCDVYNMDYQNVRAVYRRGLHSFEWIVKVYKNHGTNWKKRK